MSNEELASDNFVFTCKFCTEEMNKKNNGEKAKEIVVDMMNIEADNQDHYAKSNSIEVNDS